MSRKAYIAGITGRSGSGKTFLLNALQQHFSPGEISLLSQDHYYLPKERQSVDEQGSINFDLPDGIDQDALYTDLLKLQEGKPASRKEYTFNNPNATPELLHIEPAPLIIVEGLFIFHFQKVSSLLDLRIFIEADEALCLQRRLQRDRKERGYDAQAVHYQWEHHVQPAYCNFLEPYKETAEYVLLNTGDIQAEVAALAGLLKEKTRK